MNQFGNDTVKTKQERSRNSHIKEWPTSWSIWGTPGINQCALQRGRKCQ